MDPGTPLFISYSRKDYYFAESLAFHLLKRGVAAWLDVKDLSPGGFWERDLEGALDAASCFVLVASPESLKSENVRNEWQRAKAQGKRIVIVLRRKARLPEELADREIVDFRGAFTPALQRLIVILEGKARVQTRHSFFKLPPWIFALAITLVIPIADYFLLANWSDSSPMESPIAEAGFRVLLAGFAVLLLWFLGFSFLRRRMGMTHLMVCFAVTLAWTMYPLALYRISGRGALASYTKGMVQVITERPLEMELLGALPLAGLFIVLIVQPEELLRWTPTGRAWGWYRARCVAKAPGLESVSALKTVDRYSLLHDPIDAPAVDRLRKEFGRTGAREEAGDATGIVLLTNRTRTERLIHNAQQLPARVMIIVGTTIRLPEQFDWLWRREWIDFRHWDVDRLDRKKGLLAVPEAVPGTRFPRPVRLVHHLVCSMAALALILPALADPNDISQARAAVAMAAHLVWRAGLSTSAPQDFREGLLSGVAGWRRSDDDTLGLEFSRRDGARHEFFSCNSDHGVLGGVAGVVGEKQKRDYFLVSFGAEATSLKGAPTLSTKRNWQTLLWTLAYYVVWGLALGLLGDWGR